MKTKSRSLLFFRELQPSFRISVSVTAGLIIGATALHGQASPSQSEQAHSRLPKEAGSTHFLTECASTLSTLEQKREILQALAQNKKELTPNSSPDQIGGKSLKEIIDTKPRHVIAEQDVKCRKRPGSTSEERQAYLQKWADESVWLGPETEGPSIQVHGLTFLNERPRLVQAFKQIMLEQTQFGRAGSTPAHLQPLQGLCKSVRCAMNELLGEEVAERTLYLYARFGVRTSPYLQSGNLPLSAQELETIELALADLPQVFFEGDKGIPIHRRPQTNPESTVIANAVITLFDLWANKDREEQIQVLIHEMGHRVAENTLDDSFEWMHTTRWIETEEYAQKLILQPSRFAVFHAYQFADYLDRLMAPSYYAMTNPAEDFAETVTAYRTHPQYLKSLSPARYDFMKEVVFAGREYLSDSACAPGMGFGHEMRAQIQSEFDDPKLLALAAPIAARKCMSHSLLSFSSEYPSRLMTEKSKKCIQKFGIQVSLDQFVFDPSSKVPRFKQIHKIPSRVAQQGEAKYWVKAESLRNLEELTRKEMIKQLASSILDRFQSVVTQIQEMPFEDMMTETDKANVICSFMGKLSMLNFQKEGLTKSEASDLFSAYAHARREITRFNLNVCEKWKSEVIKSQISTSDSEFFKRLLIEAFNQQ